MLHCQTFTEVNGIFCLLTCVNVIHGRVHVRKRQIFNTRPPLICLCASFHVPHLRIDEPIATSPLERHSPPDLPSSKALGGHNGVRSDLEVMHRGGEEVRPNGGAEELALR